MAEKFDKGYVMSSRLYRNEVEPFLSDAAARVYMRLETYLTGYQKLTDYVSYSQLQGDKKLAGAHILARTTVSRALKELCSLGVISITGTHPKFGNQYQINEVSLVERFHKETSSAKLPVAKRNRTSSETLPVSSSATLHSIDINYRYLTIDIYIKSLRSSEPLKANFIVFQEAQKQIELERKKLEAEQKAKAEAERKDKARKLSYDEVIKLTSDRFKTLCDFSLWEQYVSSRSQLAKTKLTKNALNTIYKNFVEWGYDGSNQSLKTSITGNYQGLFEPKQQSIPVQQQSQKANRYQEIQKLIAEEQANEFGF